MQYPIIDNLIYAYQRNGWTGLELEYTSNILPYPYEFTDGTNNGVRYIVNDDGSVSINGTSTNASYAWIINRTSNYPRWILENRGKTVNVSSGYESYMQRGLGSLQLIFYGNPSIVITERSETIPQNLDEYDSFSVVLFVNYGSTVNRTVYPHITIGSSFIPYEPYAPPTTDIEHRLKLPLLHYFPHPVIDALISASDGQQTEEETEILKHYLTPLGIGGI